MLDMGFEEDVRFILGKTCSARQMVIFSATWPAGVHRLAQEYMAPNPVKIIFVEGRSDQITKSHYPEDSFVDFVNILVVWHVIRQMIMFLMFPSYVWCFGMFDVVEW
ncbi:hypothetical protein V6Z11_D01G150000 [Gossypium hirsutum]|uniref:ATP-dependent RNA helicase DBP3 isoform X1 n=1 Tax=Gossypium hirsutum TaxID=3635 RepID=A0A1U8KVG0_GOSHI|nr:ATP-dependent RNA helicase DBP3 isoform X1 [Gossypium hirsutum]XP_040942424.1 ATP-dependent RNA helicase DBP3 isoform X1 [Gossypium hirsutum]XP_040942425.1 ATP-dependent RNA helicase DBP3 isoform X1 [Gossypium hirsutum]XP_040942426.1 ATP-dependent RNA helicase DBP3 isoform X1 [Gossypium hirsutum]XP_040942427.1 ATP-dependent RNA helicase DBP3 isoform X1 [Gossypium hirsutum]XP_040942428.1 ATP-dependent RNA helicase DBP3 isoform X1 [Gossypium hirsutum]